MRLGTKGLLRFVGFPQECRRLLIRAFFLVLVIRLLLWVLPFTSLQKVLKSFHPRASPPASDDIPPARIAWAVTVASRYVLRATCLVRALATQVLLGRAGRSSVLHIGVMKGDRAPIEAHAWVEAEGRIIIGGSAAVLYTKLASLEYEIK